MQAPAFVPALQRLIRQGINAGRPRPMNDVVLDQLTALAKTVAVLKRDGYTVLNASAGNGLPTVTVEAGSLTDEAIALDLACYYRTSIESGLPCRWGQFSDKPNGVRVIFKERPY